MSGFLCYKFIAYPSIQQSSAAVYDCRTQDGLPIKITFSFNWQLGQTIDTLKNLYRNYGDIDAVKQLYGRIAGNVVRTVASQYSTFQFFDQLDQISSAMLSSLQGEILQQGGSVASVQLLNVGILPEFQNARTQQQAAVQAVTQAQNELNVAIINAQTLVQRQTLQAQLLVSQAVVSAAALELTNNQAIESLIARYSSQRESYLLLKQTMNLTSSQLLRFIWLDAQLDRERSVNASRLNTTTVLRVSVPPALTAGF